MLSQLVKNVDVFITPKHKMQLGYTFLLSIPALTLKRWGGDSRDYNEFANCWKLRLET